LGELDQEPDLRSHDELGQMADAFRNMVAYQKAMATVATAIAEGNLGMDIHMPDLDGIQAAWLVSSGTPHGAVIMVTSEERIDFLQKAMSAGAQGYVLKPFGKGDQLFQTMREVHARSSVRRIQAVDGVPLDAALRPRIGRRIVVVGPKGGVGSTTIAVSLALVLREQTQASVALLDADFLTGDLTIHLDLTPQRRNLDRLRSAGHFLQIARTLGYPDDRMCFVLNRASNMAGLDPRHRQRAGHTRDSPDTDWRTGGVARRQRRPPAGTPPTPIARSPRAAGRGSGGADAFASGGCRWSSVIRSRPGPVIGHATRR
jgi:DNA-binding NarL/FixJ family response regulator